MLFLLFPFSGNLVFFIILAAIWWLMTNIQPDNINPRDYPLCIQDEDVTLQLDAPQGVTIWNEFDTVLTIEMQSGGACQLPIYSNNTHGYSHAQLPNATQYPIGDQLDWAMERYVWNENEECVYSAILRPENVLGIQHEIKAPTAPGDTCELVLYITAENCGLRCTEEGTTMYILTGNEAEEDRNIATPKIFSIFDAHVGMALVALAVYSWDAWHSFQAPVIYALAHFGLEVFAEVSGLYLLEYFSDLLSSVLFFFGFPVFIYFGWVVAVEWIDYENFQDDDVASLILASSLVIEQLLDPMRYNSVTLLLLSIGIGYYTIEQWASGNISSADMLIQLAAAIVYLVSIRAIY